MKRIMIIGMLVLMSFSVNAATVSHSASEVQPGGFATGDYSFDGNVSIGIASAGANLHVNSISGPTAEFALGDNNAGRLQLLKDKGSPYDANLYWSYNPTVEAGDLNFHSSGDSGALVTFKPSGNVGIGTTNPAKKLEINGEMRLPAGNTIEWGNALADVYSDSSGNLIFRSGSSERFRITDSGNVGIGTTNPSLSKLQINGQHIMINHSDYTGLYMTDSSSTDSEKAMAVINLDGDMRLGRAEETSLASLNTYMTLTNEGRVGIGTDSPGSKLHVDGDVKVNNHLQVDYTAANFAASILNRNTATGADGLLLRIGPNTNPTSTNRYILFESQDGSNVGKINGDGAGGINYGTSSDRRIKDDIQTFSENALDKVRRMRTVTYTGKDSATGEKQMGFIAQELKSIVPQVVSGSEEDDPEENPMSVAYGRLTPILTKAIQEQQSQIEELKEKNNALKELVCQDHPDAGICSDGDLQ